MAAFFSSWILRILKQSGDNVLQTTLVLYYVDSSILVYVYMQMFLTIITG